MFFFVSPNNIPKILLVTKVVAKTPNVEALISFLTTLIISFAAFSITLSIIKAYKNEYKYLHIVFKLFIILSKNIIIIYSKTFIKIKDLVYFNKLKKYSKI